MAGDDFVQFGIHATISGVRAIRLERAIVSTAGRSGNFDRPFWSVCVDTQTLSVARAGADEPVFGIAVDSRDLRGALGFFAYARRRVVGVVVGVADSEPVLG
jgi:hypothetical protein